MVLRYRIYVACLPILLSSLLVMSSAASTAAEGYHPDEFLGLDLSKAVLSPKPLGPANTFGTVPAKIGADSDVAGPRVHARRRRLLYEQCMCARRKSARHSTKQARASSSQSAGRPGHGYADPGLALQIRRHLQVETIVTRPS